MLRLTLFITVAVALAGCAVVPQDAWRFDPTHPQPRPLADPALMAPLNHRIAGLQAELNDVRSRIAAQPDAPHRLALYPQLHDIGHELSPLQRELAQYAQAR